jgi:hypothetical protein
VLGPVSEKVSKENYYFYWRAAISTAVVIPAVACIGYRIMANVMRTT